MRQLPCPSTKSAAICRYYACEEVCCVFRISSLRQGGAIRFDASPTAESFYEERVQSRMANGRAKSAKPTCESCFFHQNLLCAVSDTGPCATFRPAHPDGLRPPSQMRFVFRQERRLQVAWAFPSASEQVALHQ
jgi:hypothetical protein